MPETRREMALRHVISGREIIAAQKERIERRRAKGEDTAHDEALLVQYEHSQAIFEDDLMRLSE